MQVWLFIFSILACIAPLKPSVEFLAQTRVNTLGQYTFLLEYVGRRRRELSYWANTPKLKVITVGKSSYLTIKHNQIKRTAAFSILNMCHFPFNFIIQVSYSVQSFLSCCVNEISWTKLKPKCSLIHKHEYSIITYGYTPT